jgi:hypothetical protein
MRPSAGQAEVEGFKAMRIARPHRTVKNVQRQYISRVRCGDAVVYRSEAMPCVILASRLRNSFKNAFTSSTGVPLAPI